MFQKSCKTLGFTKYIVCQIPLVEKQNHFYPMAFRGHFQISIHVVESGRAGARRSHRRPSLWFTSDVIVTSLI